jgi:Polysaccharide deacetylase
MKFPLLALFTVLISVYSVSCFYVNEARCVLNKNCKLPKCNCDSDKIPVNITNKFRLDQLPQLIVLTIDDQELDFKSYQVYKKLFDSFRNPNGCPIKATFFVSDSYNRTSYCLVRNLYENGHEIAVSTLNNECPHSMCSSIPTFEPWDLHTWTKQILKMRKNLEMFAAIPRSELTGFRAPLLEPTANLHYRIISAHNFLYDSSLILNSESIVWPYTFDYKTMVPSINNGPTESFTGLWEMPIHIFLDSGKLQALAETSANKASSFRRKNLHESPRRAL